MSVEGDERQGVDLSGRLAQNRRLAWALQGGPAVRRGETGDAVRRVQEGLVADGLTMPHSFTKSGEMDGIFGAETVAKTMQFQARHDLLVDGIVGRQTLTKLGQLPAPKPGLRPVCVSLSFLSNTSSEAEVKARVFPALEASSSGKRGALEGGTVRANVVPQAIEYDRAYCHYIGCRLTEHCGQNACSLHFCDDSPCDVCPPMIITAACYYPCVQGDEYAFTLLTRLGVILGPFCVS